jgi:PAS domain S-box-containing protein
MRHVYPALGIALAYVIVGRLSLLLAIPPGFASPVWPAAGIALAAALIWGLRVLPGVALGSYVVNLMAGIMGGAPDIWAATPVAAGIGLGATLQTAIGAIILRQLLPDTKWQLESPREIALLVLVGGPLASMTNALIGPSILQYYGLMTAEAWGANVFTWWVGDAIGAIVSTPVALLLLSRAGVSRSRKAAVAIPMFMIFVGVIAAFSTARHYGVDRARMAFEQLAATHHFTLVEHLEDMDRLLLAMDGLFSAREDASRDEFRIFARRAFSRYDGIQALEWVPRVPAAERAAYEAGARADGLVDYSFKHIENGVAQEAPDLPAYYPVHYVEPLAGNELALGLVSSSSAPSRQATIDAARDSGEMVIAEPVRLVQETGAQAGLLLFSPVYRGGDVPAELDERRARLIGVTEAVFRMEDFLNSVLPEVGHSYQMHIRDLGASVDRWDIFGEAAAPDPLAVEYLLEFGGRQWQITFSPTPTFHSMRADWTSWLVLTTGLLLVSMLGLVLMQMSAQTDFIARMVDEKTYKLAALSRQLSSVLNNAGDGILSADVHGANLSLNASALRLLGYEPDEAATINLADILEPIGGDSATSDDASAMHPLALPVIGQRGRFRRKDGGEFIAEYSSEPIRDDSAEGAGVVVVFRDITTRIAAEQSLQTANEATDQALRDLAVQEARFRTLVGNIPGAVYRCDFDENVTMRYLSDFIEEITGYPASEFIGDPARSYASIIHPDDRTDVTQALRMGVAGSGYFVAQYRIMRRDGGERWVFERGHVVKNPDGEIDHLDGFIHDITDRQLAAAERERLISDLSDANEELGRCGLYPAPGEPSCRQYR